MKLKTRLLLCLQFSSQTLYRMWNSINVIRKSSPVFVQNHSIPFSIDQMPVNCLAVRRRQTENWSLDRVQTGAFDWRSQELGMFLRMKCFLSTLQTNEITLCGIFSRHSADTHPRVLVGRISSQESLCLLHAFCSPSSDDLGLI